MTLATWLAIIAAVAPTLAALAAVYTAVAGARANAIAITEIHTRLGEFLTATKAQGRLEERDSQKQLPVAPAAPAAPTAPAAPKVSEKKKAEGGPRD